MTKAMQQASRLHWLIRLIAFFVVFGVSFGFFYTANHPVPAENARGMIDWGRVLTAGFIGMFATVVILVSALIWNLVKNNADARREIEGPAGRE